MKFKETIVISLGGSLIYPNTLDVDFLKRFKKMVIRYIQKNNRIIIVTGGGSLCRQFNQAALFLNKRVSPEELDWMGIRVTKVNAELIRIMFNQDSYFKTIDTPDEKLVKDKAAKIIVAGGWKPGASSDHMAVQLAKTFGAQRIGNLSNIDYVFDKDPVKYKGAHPIKEIEWKEFRKMVGKKWNPGAHVPFDPIASKLAHALKLEVSILNGHNIANVYNFLMNKRYIGTRIYHEKNNHPR